MLGILAILLILFGVIIVVGGIFFWLYFKTEKEPLETNLPIVINLIDKFSPYNLGIEKSIKKVKDGRMHAVMIPKDYHFKKGYMVPEEQHIIIGRGRRIILPRGEVSKKRDILLYLPKDQEELTNYFKQNPELAKVLEGKINYENMRDSMLIGFEEWRKNISNLMKEIGLGELSTEAINKMKAQFTQIMDQVIETRTKEKTYK